MIKHEKHAEPYSVRPSRYKPSKANEATKGTKNMWLQEIIMEITVCKLAHVKYKKYSMKSDFLEKSANERSFSMNQVYS